jgi:hypothetical protein
MAYNGWSNYETWAVALWIGNEAASYKYWRMCAQTAVRNSVDTEHANGMLAVMLRDELEESMPDLGASLWADLLSSALCEVVWHEIAADLLSDIVERPAEQKTAVS